jgi:site-specific DNA-methyltransferase (adenine-specific)
MKYQILHGDNRDTLKTIADNSIDAIVTDPPYGIDFLGKSWDANTGALETYQECLRVLKPGGHIVAFSAARTYHHLAITLEQAGFEIRDQIMWIYSSGFPKGDNLKPAHEPIAMARKPGKSILNIDACRIEYSDHKPSAGKRTSSFHNATGKLAATQSGGDGSGGWVANEIGRFPSNVIGEISNYQKYFYCPKVSQKERMEFNNHPTVKPIELMKYLIKLITPPGGTVLDPFNGSGSTGCAAVELGMEYIGCELDANYVEIATRRIEAWYEHTNPTTYNQIFKQE